MANAYLGLPQGLQITGSQKVGAALVGIPVDSRMTADTTALRDTIASSKRYEGLICYVKDTSKAYMLVGGITNTNWTELVTAEMLAGHNRLRKVIRMTNTEPTSGMVAGDRYIINSAPTGTNWSSHPNHIATYGASGWSYVIPEEGTVVYVDEDNKDALFIDDGTPHWELRAVAVFDHNSLTGIQGGTAGASPEFYHLTAAQRTALHSHANTSVLDLITDVDGILYYNSAKVGDVLPTATATGDMVVYLAGTGWIRLPTNATGSPMVLTSDATGNVGWGSATASLPDTIDGGNLDLV